MESPPDDNDTESVVDSVEITIESGKIREFVSATEVTDPVHTSAQTALDAGFTELPATATHVVVAGHQRSQQEFVRKLGLAIERVVVGSVDWSYSRPLVSGDRLVGTRRIVDDTVRAGKRGGQMRLVTLETAWVDQTGSTAVTQREVLIERGQQ